MCLKWLKRRLLSDDFENVVRIQPNPSGFNRLHVDITDIIQEYPIGNFFINKFVKKVRFNVFLTNEDGTTSSAGKDVESLHNHPRSFVSLIGKK